jgi:hypothetical protein
MSHWQVKQEFQIINGLASSNRPSYAETAATKNKETPEKTNLMEIRPHKAEALEALAQLNNERPSCKKFLELKERKINCLK